MTEGFTVPLAYVQHMAEALRNAGVSVAKWLAMSGFAEAALDSGTLQLTEAGFRKLILDGIEISQEPAIGLFVGQRLTAASHGVVGYAAINSARLGDALELVSRYASLRTSLITITRQTHRREIRLCIEEPAPLGEIRRPFLEATTLSLRNIVDSISLGACPVLKVALPFAAPDYAALARDMFRCEVAYGQSWTGLSFPSDAEAMPIKLADQHAFEEADRICRFELEKLAANTSLSARVRRMFLEQQNGFPSLSAIARVLHMTPRTLHRRLLDEGTSYRQLLEEVRHTLAIEHLKAGRFSFEEIAFVLGYTDLANFRRAFRRWEKQPPSAYLSGATRAPSPRAKR